MPSRFFWPPLRPFLMGVPTMVCAWDCRPKLAIRLSTRSNACFLPMLLAFLSASDCYSTPVRTYLGRESRAANIMVSLTVRLPIRASSCST